MDQFKWYGFTTKYTNMNNPSPNVWYVGYGKAVYLPELAEIEKSANRPDYAKDWILITVPGADIFHWLNSEGTAWCIDEELIYYYIPEEIISVIAIHFGPPIKNTVTEKMFQDHIVALHDEEK